jgi:two-component system response regulator AtoC
MEFRALIVDDEETYSSSIRRLLGRRGVRADVAATCAEGLACAKRQGYDLVVLDQLLPDGDGLDLIAPLRALNPPPRVLMMTAFGTIDHAVEAMRRGAWDYVTKSTDIDEVVGRILDTRQVAQAELDPLPEGQEQAALAALVGDSPAMREVRRRIGEVSQSPDTTVLLTGESGTGKGLAARAIHACGPRQSEPFVAIDCVALPPTLAESELFGHERGAFTGADRARPGRLELGGAGTVLLDEIGDMEPALQGKLLRVLEERVFDRVGGVRPVPMRARVIAASHRDLGALVEEGRFRLDLYHRLMVFPIRLPALREREGDILTLSAHFTAEFGRRLGRRVAPLGADVQRALCAYGFPGNVRELRNILERAVILAKSGEVTVEMLPERVLSPRAAPAPAPAAPLDPGAFSLSFRPGTDTLDGLTQRVVDEALRRAGGNKARAAILLGISRFALMRRVSRSQSD